MKNDLQGSLDDQLASLPRDVIPPPHVWARTAAAIEQPRRTGRIVALAASIAGVCVAGTLTWTALHGRLSAPPAPTMASTVRAPDFDESNKPALRLARAELEQSYRQRLAQLDGPTRAKIEASLAIIHQAHADIRAALAAQPADPLLAQLLASNWHDEFDLYDQVVQATQLTQTRI